MKMSWKLMVDDFIYHFPISIYVEVVEYVIIKYSYVISTFWNAFDPPSAKQKLLSLLDMWNLVVKKLIGHVSKVSWLTIESMPISFSFPMYLYKRVKKEKKWNKGVCEFSELQNRCERISEFESSSLYCRESLKILRDFRGCKMVHSYWIFRGDLDPWM